MASINLDDIRKAADEKYGPFVINIGDSTVTLLPYLRLTKDKRHALDARQGRVDKAAEDEDVSDTFREMIRIVAQNDEQATTLLDVIGDDAAYLSEVLVAYTNATRQGEALPSQG